MFELSGKSVGFAKKITSEDNFQYSLKEISQEGEFPFVKCNKYSVVYFTSSEKKKSDIIEKETEKFINTHTLNSELILKPRNKWVMFSSLNWKVINKKIESISNKKNESASNITPLVSSIYKSLNNEALQYYTYLSELEDNLHRATHPNYQVNSEKRKQLTVSRDLLQKNLRFKQAINLEKPYKSNLSQIFKESPNNEYKISMYTRKSFQPDFNKINKIKIERFVMSQKNKYNALKTLNYCARINFGTKKRKQSKVTK